MDARLRQVTRWRLDGLQALVSDIATARGAWAHLRHVTAVHAIRRSEQHLSTQISELSSCCTSLGMTAGVVEGWETILVYPAVIMLHCLVATLMSDAVSIIPSTVGDQPLESRCHRAYVAHIVTWYPVPQEEAHASLPRSVVSTVAG